MDKSLLSLPDKIPIPEFKSNDVSDIYEFLLIYAEYCAKQPVETFYHNDLDITLRFINQISIDETCVSVSALHPDLLNLLHRALESLCIDPYLKLFYQVGSLVANHSGLSYDEFYRSLIN